MINCWHKYISIFYSNITDIFPTIHRNNPTSALHLHQVDLVAFHDCTFTDNIQRQLDDPTYTACHSQSGDGNSFGFLDNTPSSGAISIHSNEYPFKLLISNCLFEHNSARTNTITDLPPSLLSFGHGGAMYVRFVRTSNVQMCIQDTTFTSNTAEASGGAVQLSIADHSYNNKIALVRCMFSRNNCSMDECSGGAVRIDVFQESSLNAIHVIDSVFTDNSGGAGGGLALLVSSHINGSDELIRPLLLQNCTFLHNVARQDGSAVSIFSVTPINRLTFPVFVEDWLVSTCTMFIYDFYLAVFVSILMLQISQNFLNFCDSYFIIK